MFVQIRLADALLSPRAGGRPGYPVHRNVARDSFVFIYLLFVLYLFLHFQLDTSPRRRAVGTVNLRFGYLLLPHLPPRPDGGPRSFFA